jgi:hypothetical protein
MNQNHVTGFRLLDGDRLNGEKITWPQGRQHAGSRGVQMQIQTGAQNFRCQAAFTLIASLANHYDFLGEAQLSCGSVVFTHAKARVSNTRSNWKSGF